MRKAKTGTESTSCDTSNRWRNCDLFQQTSKIKIKKRRQLYTNNDPQRARNHRLLRARSNAVIAQHAEVMSKEVQLLVLLLVHDNVLRVDVIRQSKSNILLIFLDLHKTGDLEVSQSCRSYTPIDERFKRLQIATLSRFKQESTRALLRPEYNHANDNILYTGFEYNISSKRAQNSSPESIDDRNDRASGGPRGSIQLK